MYLQSKFSNKRQSADKFQLFASLNFNLLGCTLSSLLKWEPKKYLRRPLLNLHPVMIDQAVIANRLIVGYMSKSAEEEEKSIYCNHCAVCEIDITQVSKLVSIGCQRPEECGSEIRDEIYCQLIKETTGNTSRRSCFRGYQLILSCLAGFPPSGNLAPFLLSHLLTGCQGGAMLSRRCVRYAENCVRALELIQESGSRQCGLTRHEIITILSGNSRLTIKVWLTDEFAVDIAVDSWTTVKELKLAACAFVGIKDTSILTINAISSSVDQLGLQADTDNLASSRRVISILFDQLYHHHSILATAEFNTMRKGRFQLLFGSTKHLTTFDVASRALYTLDTNLQIEFTGTTDGALNASESFFFSEHIENNQDGKKMKPALNLQSGLFELKKSLATSISSVKVNLKLCLHLWIFPYHTKCEDYSYPRDSLSNKFDGEKCMISNYIGTDDKTHCEDAPDFFMAVNPGNSGDGNMALYWPSEEPTRNILFAQLIKSVADGTLECVEDIESLRLAALMFAEQHQV